ncbi:MAG: hypothetical protein ACK400_14785, partial [Pseudanabaena sp.]
AEEFSKIGYKFLWEDDHPIASLEAQMAYQSSVLLNPDNYSAWRDLGTHVTQKPKKVSETAIPSEIAAKP